MSSDKPIKQTKPRGRPPKSKTIYAKQESVAEPIIESVTELKKPVNEIVQPPPPSEPQPSVSLAPTMHSATESVESVKIPIKISKKRGKKAEPQGKILTIIDEPVRLSVPEPVKLSVTESVPVKEPKDQKPVKTPRAPKEPKAPKLPKLPKLPKEPKPPKRDEDLYRMVYALQQSLQQSRPKKKVVQYDSTDTDSASSSDISDDEEPEEKYTRKVQKRLETVKQIEKKLNQARQPRGKYDHLTLF